jgi:hypothetical protein
MLPPPPASVVPSAPVASASSAVECGDEVDHGGAYGIGRETGFEELVAALESVLKAAPSRLGPLLRRPVGSADYRKEIVETEEKIILTWHIAHPIR